MEAALPGEHSFKITLSNNKTEKEAVEYVMRRDPRMVKPDSAGRRAILEHLEVPKGFGRAFDLIRLARPPESTAEVAVDSLETLALIELKATKKRLVNFPYGFFFGATKNELDLGDILGDRFKFCFVCLHPETPGHQLLTIREMEPLVRSKRIQFQINFLAGPPV